ncbi:asparagine--tRNA ligase [bacterium]|nr:asparagine--tRNA ligase [bacterium]
MVDARISELSKHVGTKVQLKGWVHGKRSSGKIAFLQMRDGSGFVQVVYVKSNVPEAVWEGLGKLTQETSITLTGLVKEDTRSKGGYELEGDSLEILQIAQDFPIGPKEHGPDFLLSNRHLWLRSQKPHAVLRIRDRFVKAVRDFFDQDGFVLVDTPIFTPSACEGTTTLFETEYFGDKAYLSQSGQLYSEASAMAFGKVYCFGPTFRAEKSKTRRHLTEFWMIEPEVAFADLDSNMVLAERFLEYTVQYVLKTCEKEFATLGRDTTRLQNVKAPFPRISYTDAVEILKKKNIPFEWGGDFGAPEETAIGEDFDKPVFIHRFPSKIKAFYMKHDPTNPEVALGVDCIAPEGYGEIIGGGQREEDLEVLRQRIAAHGLREQDFDWYLDLRKYGSVPHAGFGLGLERTISWICGLEHLREAAAFPRMMYRIRP